MSYKHLKHTSDYCEVMRWLAACCRKDSTGSSIHKAVKAIQKTSAYSSPHRMQNSPSLTGGRDPECTIHQAGTKWTRTWCRSWWQPKYSLQPVLLWWLTRQAKTYKQKRGDVISNLETQGVMRQRCNADKKHIPHVQKQQHTGLHSCRAPTDLCTRLLACLHHSNALQSLLKFNTSWQCQQQPTSWRGKLRIHLATQQLNLSASLTVSGVGSIQFPLSCATLTESIPKALAWMLRK